MKLIHCIVATASYGSTLLSKIYEAGSNFHKHFLTPMSEYADSYGGFGDTEDGIVGRNVLAQSVGIVGMHGAISAALTDWEEHDGPQWQVISDDQTKEPFERDVALTNALAIMGMLIIRYPSIHAAEFPVLVGFPLFCSKQNFDRIRLANSFELEYRLAMYEQAKRSDSPDALDGLAEWGSLCPDLINDRDSNAIELRGNILIYRVIRTISPFWVVNRVHITVNAVGAFHNSRSLLLGPAAVFLEGRFSVTTQTSAGNSEEFRDWLVAVDNDLGSSPVLDKALGRFFALCIWHEYHILWQIPLELAEAIVLGNGPTDGSAASLVDGFRDLIPRDELFDITADDLISILRIIEQPVVPFLGSVPDSAKSSLGLFMSTVHVWDRAINEPNAQLWDSQIDERVSEYIQTNPVSKEPLELWTSAGGPELLRLSYSKPNFNILYDLMTLFAYSGADADETGISVFCQNHQFELQDLLQIVSISSNKIEVILSRRGDFENSGQVASIFFAADWMTQCPSVLGSSSYLKGIVLSLMIIRDIALKSERVHLKDAIIESPSGVRLNHHVDKKNLLGRKIGWYLIEQHSAEVPKIPLSAFESALSGKGPVATGFAAMIYPTTIDRLVSLGITPVVLQEIVSFNPPQVPIELRDVRIEIDNIQHFISDYPFRTVCNHFLEAVGPIEDAELRVRSRSIGLNKLCIDHPADCLSAFESFKAIESPESIDIIVPKLPSLFPEFWTANRADLTAVLIRARHSHKVASTGKAAGGIKSMDVHRDNVLKDSWKWLSEGPVGSHLRLCSVSFVNEEGTGPGVFAEWFTLLASELGKKMLQLQTELPQYYVPNPTASPAEMVALGRLLGLALVFQKPVPLGLPLMLFARLLPDYTDYFAAFAKDDPTVFASYQTILGMDENVLNDAEIEINSVLVTVANRVQLIEDAIRGPFQGIVMERILDGFSDIVPPEAFSHTGITSPNELQLLIQGVADVDIGDMQAHVGEYVGYTSNDDQIVWLFSFLEASDLETRRKFLHFVTGLNAVGVGGFLTNPINIQYISGEDTRLPSSHTCSRMLDLPKYSSRAILEEKLTIAMNADSAMLIA